jgi:4-amino-4-deoxy-L-arabinose transferase-like glycosyltransferase
MKTVLRLLPLFIIHILIIVIYSHGHPGLVTGETRYYTDAMKLIEHGEQAVGKDPVPWNGPGFPLFLVPFVLLHAPNIVMRIANAVLMLLASLYLLRSLRYYVAKRWAYLAVYCMGLYPVLLKYMPKIITEPFCVFLSCGLVFHMIHMKRFPGRRWLHLVLAGVYFGFLALTKVLFGYVIAVAIVLFLVTALIRRKRSALRPLLVAVIALAVCVPYLYKNYSRTGKPFYWAQAGGLSLYWMSSPFEEEYGDWLSGTKFWLGNYWKAEKHHEFMETLKSLPAVERDDRLRRAALRNIKEHPGKFARNWAANVTRLFLHHPFSYKDQAMKDSRILISGSLLLVLCLLCMIPTVRSWRRIPSEVRQVFLIGLFYVAGNSLLSAYDRMLLPVFPMMAVWLVYILSRTIEPGCFNLKFH